ncbi:hypothetical protein L7F22_017224 [Adiantum nelumboides]|nr:hypothetical protein [Adiantum nelumboides]
MASIIYRVPSQALLNVAAPSHPGSCSSSSVPPKITLSLLRSSSSFFAGSSSCVLQPLYRPRAMRRSHPTMVNVIKAAFIFEWIGYLLRFVSKTPAKLLAQKIEDDLDRASKMVKSGASIVVKIAREADEFAEEVERIAERTEAIAEKVAKATETIEERIDEVLDVIEGEKKVVITSYKLVDNESKVAVKSTTIAKDDNTTVVTVEKSVVNDSNSPDKSESP